jgi:hypothetical protein
VLEPGTNSTLRITLENVGLVQELIPNKAGDTNEISAEAKDELHSVDADNITARLSGSGPVVVTSAPRVLAYLPTGGVAQLDFNVTTGVGADGWYSLLLETEYEHQMDVKVSNSSSSSLYRPSNSSQKISILVQGPDRSLKVEGVVSDLYPGGNGTILAVIKNNGQDVARNCTARLMAVPPLQFGRPSAGPGCRSQTNCNRGWQCSDPGIPACLRDGSRQPNCHGLIAGLAQEESGTIPWQLGHSHPFLGSDRRYGSALAGETEAFWQDL